VGKAFSPLDEELALLPGPLTPNLQESLTRLGTWLPFARAAKELDFFTHVDLSEATACRQAETAGAAYVAVQTAEVDRIEHDLPPAPPGPVLQQISVDGALIPLVHKEWAEVRTLAVGVVELPVLEHGEMVVHTGQISYFSRLCDAETFGRLALVEIHRRGTETAKTVCAVNDGAAWEQEFVDLHCPQAVRILDFPHAAEYVATAGQVVYGQDTVPFHQWLDQELSTLKHGRPQTVLADLRQLENMVLAREPSDEQGAATIRTCVAYLEKRVDQIRYADFIALGYPIASGMVESGNKLVVEARLKGAGMHWARVHVNPMLALRTIACSDRWEEAWPQICQQMRQEARGRTRERRHRRCLKEQPPSSPVEVTQAAAPVTTQPQGQAASVVQPAPPRPVGISAPTQRHRPAADHPWRRPLTGRTRREAHQPVNRAKT
jgi:hypothetical protein